MKRTYRLILIAMLVICSFLGGFTYNDLRTGSGIRGAFMSLQDAFNNMEASATTSIDMPKTAMSPVETYWNAYAYLDSNYYSTPDSKPIEQRKLTYAAIRGMMHALHDQYTRFLEPDDYSKMQQENRGDFEGIGALLDVKDGQVFIKKPIKNSPAMRASLMKGDVILKVDDHLIQGLDIDDVVKQIRGKRGTTVKLTIERKGVPEPMEISIVRDVIPMLVVEDRMVDEANKIGYISLAQFNEKSDQLVEEALNDLESQGVKSLILDLRENPGGLLDMAVAIGSRFVPSGDIVIIKEKGGITTERRVDPMKHNHKMYPLVVLVNHHSASASEIVSGAIQDHHAGTIIGTDSFGKGLVQMIINLEEDGSAVSITTSRYLTPSGRDVHKKKIHPDIIVPSADTVTASDDDDANDATLKRAVQFLKEHGHGKVATATVPN